MPFARPLAVAVVLCGLGAALAGVGELALAENRATDEPAGWASGRALVEQLSSPAGVSWSNAPLARALQNFAAAQHVAVVLDRRVDPDQTITLALASEPLATIFQKIARHLHVDYSQFGPVAYLGPPSAARRLRTLAALRLEEVRPLPQATSRKFLQIRRWHWDDLAEPRQLLDQLAEEAGVKLVGAEKIPHDLWRETDLPAMTWIDRLTLLAAEFDLTFELDRDGGQVKLVPMPAKVALSRTYQAGRQPDSLAKRWAKALPEAHVAVEGNKIRVDGLLEAHEQIEERLQGAPTQRTTVTAGSEVYQLSIENGALSQVVEQLAARLNLEFQWDRAAIDAAGISVDQLISVKVQNASLDDLLRAVFDKTGLTFRREGQAIRILPTKSR